MTSPQEYDRAIARIARRQHGLITAAQLAQLGMGASSIKHRVDNGRLFRVYRGVYAVGHDAATLDARWHAAVLAAGDGAVLSHIGAAMLHGVWRRGTWHGIDVVTARRHHPIPKMHIHECRKMLPRDRTKRRGIPATSVARTLLDLADVLSIEHLANVAHEAELWNRVRPRQLDDVIARSRGRAAVTVLRAALELNARGDAGAMSGLEDAFIARARERGADEPRVNPAICDDQGPMRVDALFERANVIVEVDGPPHERTRTQREDGERDVRLRALGFQVIRCTPSTFDGALDQVAEAHKRAAQSR